MRERCRFQASMILPAVLSGCDIPPWWDDGCSISHHDRRGERHGAGRQDAAITLWVKLRA